jgi:hypothetical protein
MFMSFLGKRQDKAEIGTLFLTGKIVDEKKRGLESKIYDYTHQELVKTVPNSKIEKFNIDLDMQDPVALVIFADGYVSKTLIISTKIHPAKQKRDHAFPFFVDVYPVGRVPAPIDLDRPMGRINYQGGQFIYDTKFTEESNDKLKEFVEERRQMRVREIEE